MQIPKNVHILINQTFCTPDLGGLFGLRLNHWNGFNHGFLIAGGIKRATEVRKTFAVLILQFYLHILN